MGDNYQSQINKLLDNQKYLMSGVNTVYPGFSLDNLINQATKTEYDGIVKFNNEATNVNIQTRLNLAKLYNEQNEVLSTNQLLFGSNKDIYNSDFNENIEKIDQLNNIISTKNQTIKINEYEQSKKDRIIYLMKKIILFLVLMIIPIIFIAMEFVSIVTGIIFIIVCAIITVIVVFIQMKNNQDNDVVNIMNKTKNTAKEFIIPILKDILPDSYVKSCPTKDKNKPSVNYENNIGNEVWLDNSQNAWEEGDIPSIGATKQGYLALGEEAEPMPYYGGDSTTTKYQCKWMYDPAKRTNMNRGTEFTTTIPCEYYPGYKTINKIS
jgi:heme/copper-type cytochrome/quinol oxidase subunit 4